MAHHIEGKKTGVVIPTAYRPILMIEALESVLAGNILPGHIVVVVDSIGDHRDKELSILEDWLSQNSQTPPITILEGGESGPGHARNLGAKKLKTEYIAFLDSDDIWHPTKLQRQLHFLQKRPHLAGCQTLETWEKNGKTLNQPERLLPSTGKMSLESMEACMVSPSSIILKHEVFSELGGFDPEFPVCEDYEFWLRLLRKYTLGLVPEKLVTKRSGGWPQLSQKHSQDLYRAQALLKNANLIHRKFIPDAYRIFFKKLDMVKLGAEKRGLPDPGVNLRDQGKNIFQSL
jgi:glycosyltransferase involved in cell wall biosynthesis